jgi:hypothetical protein
VPKIALFESHYQHYEARFEKHEAAYIMELLALRLNMPWYGWEISLRWRRTTALPKAKP